MHEQKANFPAMEMKAFNVGAQQIDQQDQSNRPAAREHRNCPMTSAGRPIDEETAEKLRLHHVKPKADLRERACEDQHQRQAEADDGELQRTEKCDETVNHDAIFFTGKLKLNAITWRS